MYGTIKKIGREEYKKILEGNEVKALGHFEFSKGLFAKVTCKTKVICYVFWTPCDEAFNYIFSEGAFEYVKATKKVCRQLLEEEIAMWLYEFQEMQEGDYCFVL